jgi:hypothetical protein
MRFSISLALAALLVPAGMALAGGGDCTDGNCTITPPSAWAQVSSAAPDATITYPRRTQGAVLQRIELTTQQPVDGETTLCDGRQEATARYRSSKGSVTFQEVISPGEDCTEGDPLRFRCTTARLSGLGRTRDCTSRTWRIITWGGYQLGVGGTYTLSGPRSFPLVAMARSVR